VKSIKTLENIIGIRRNNNTVFDLSFTTNPTNYTEDPTNYTEKPTNYTEAIENNIVTGALVGGQKCLNSYKEI